MKAYFPEYILKDESSFKGEISPDMFSKSMRNVRIWSEEDAEERSKKFMRENGLEKDGNGFVLKVYDTVTKKTKDIAKYMVTDQGISKQR